MLEKIIKQIEKELKNNGYRENDNIDNTTKMDLIERSDLKRALDFRFSKCTEVNIEEIHKLSKYGVIRDAIEKYLETNNIIIVTKDYNEVDVEPDENDKDNKKSNHLKSELDVLTQYYRDISKIPLLTSEEEVELFMQKKELEDDMNSIAKSVWSTIIKELSININCIPKSCLKDIKEFYSQQLETLDKIKNYNNKLQKTNNAQQYKYVKNERDQLKSNYMYYELEAANKICKRLIEEKNNGSTNIPNSCIDLINKYEPLNEENRKIKKRIIDANLRLVVSIAVKYAPKEEKILSMSDMIQEGNFGLMKALDRFDVTKGYKFSTYATWWIRQSITRSKADQARTIRIPVHVVESIYKLYGTKNMLEQKLNRMPSSQELAEALNVSVEKVEDILKISQEPASLYAVVGEDDDSYLIDFIPDEITNTEEEAGQQELHKVVMDVLDTLSDREKRIVILRFGLDGNDPRTLQEVGKEFNVTRERIRQIEAKALRRLRHPSRSKKLKDFLK